MFSFADSLNHKRNRYAFAEKKKKIINFFQTIKKN